MKCCTANAPILPKVPAGPTKTSSSPNPVAICAQCKCRCVNKGGSCLAGKAVIALGLFLSKHLEVPQGRTRPDPWDKAWARRRGGVGGP